MGVVMTGILKRAIIGSAALLWAGGASATTFHILQVEPDESAITVIEPATIADLGSGMRKASLIDIDVFGSVDITEFEMDCAQPRLKVTAEGLYDTGGVLRADKTRQNQLDWMVIPDGSRLAEDRKMICGWPGSRDTDLELTAPGFWPLVKAISGTLEVPEGFFD